MEHWEPEWEHVPLDITPLEVVIMQESLSIWGDCMAPNWCSISNLQNSIGKGPCEWWLVLATGPGNPPAVRVWTAKTGRFGSRTVQKPDLQTLGGPNPDPYPSTRGLRRVWLDPSVPISGSAFRVSHLWSHSDMRLLIVKYWPLYVTVRFRRISRLNVPNMNTQAPNYILKMSVNRASTIFGLASSVIWVLRDHKHP